MVRLQTKMKQTIKIVESRVQANKSDDPIKDLAFLSEHYRAKQEWDKANAATRHMLAIAEGTASSFEITPIDIELHQSKMEWNRRTRRNKTVQIILVVLLSPLVGVLCALNLAGLPSRVGDRAGYLDYMVGTFPNNAGNYLDRAQYYYYSDRTRALADCDSALALDARNSTATELKATILLEEKKPDQAWQILESNHQDTASHYRLEAEVERAQDKHMETAISLEKLHAIEPKWNDYYDICIEYGLAGRLDDALRTAELRVLNAGSDKLAKVQGWRLQARYLVALGRNKEAIAAATKSIDLSPSQETPPFCALSEPAFTYRAEAHFNLSEYSEAVADATKALQFKGRPMVVSTGFRALKVRSDSYEKLGMIEESTQDKHQLLHLKSELLGEDS